MPVIATHRKPSRTRTRLAAPAPEEPLVADVTPDPAEVARLAYFHWQARSGQNGTAEEDWLRAERELRQRKVVTNT